MHVKNTGLLVALFVGVVSIGIVASKMTLRPLVRPEVNNDSWVMIEIWPEVSEITLSAYFLDSSGPKNRSLCEATKLVFDRDAKYKEAKLKKTLTSYRRCLSVDEAVKQGLIATNASVE